MHTQTCFTSALMENKEKIDPALGLNRAWAALMDRSCAQSSAPLVARCIFVWFLCFLVCSTSVALGHHNFPLARLDCNCVCLILTFAYKHKEIHKFRGKKERKSHPKCIPTLFTHPKIKLTQLPYKISYSTILVLKVLLLIPSAPPFKKDYFMFGCWFSPLRLTEFVSLLWK